MNRFVSRFVVLVLLVGMIGTNLILAQEVPTIHHGAVTVISADIERGIILSGGTDGFIVGWDPTRKNILADFQVSPYAITAIALRPGKPELVIAESDGMGLHRVSAWNYLTSSRLFTLRFKDVINYLSYSGAGTFILVGRNAPNGIVVLEPTTGTSLIAPTESTGSIRFAATGKSEKTMVTYAVSGELAYWDLVNGSRLRRLSLAPNLRSPTLFGNNRFFAGLSDESIIIYDALNGKEMKRKTAGSATTIIRLAEESTSILAIEAYGTVVALSYIQTDSTSSLATQYASLPAEFYGSAISFQDKIVFALKSGSIAQTNPGSFQVDAYETTIRRRFQDAAVIGDSILLSDGDRSLSLAADPSSLINGLTYYTQPVDARYQTVGDRDGRYIKWFKDGTVTPILMSRYSAVPLPVPIGAPLLTVKMFGNRVLFLDNLGQLTVVDLNILLPVFTFSSLGLIDADFLDEKKLIAAKGSTLPPYAPLLIIDIETGETAPMEIQGKTAFKLYRGQSDYTYAALVNDQAGNINTSIIRLDSQPPYIHDILMTYQAEDINVQFVEAATTLITTLGGDGASAINSNGFTVMERSAGLPKRLISYGPFFIILDNDGNLFWYDAESGTKLYSMYLSDDSWNLIGKNLEISGFIR